MESKIDKIILTILGLFVIFSSVFGIFLPNFYSFRNNSITKYEICGQDIISLVIGIFIILIVQTKIKRKIEFIIGFLIYILYTYSYFSFGLVFSTIYPIYIIIILISFICLLNIVSLVFIGSKANSNISVRKSISIYIFIIVFIVGFIDFKDIINKTVFTKKGFDSKSIFYILDLAFLFPSMIYAAISNYKKSIFGKILSGAFLVKTITLMPAIIISDILHYIFLNNFVDFSFDIIAFFIMLSAIAMFIIYCNEKKRLTIAST